MVFLGWILLCLLDGKEARRKGVVIPRGLVGRQVVVELKSIEDGIGSLRSKRAQ